MITDTGERERGWLARQKGRRSGQRSYTCGRCVCVRLCCMIGEGARGFQVCGCVCERERERVNESRLLLLRRAGRGEYNKRVGF